MAVDSVAGGTGIAVSSAIGDVTIDFDPPPGTSLPGNPTLVNVVSTALGATSQRIASVAYVRAVAPPAGGTANQVLAKVDATNFNYAWINQTGGPGGPVTASDVSVDPATLIPVPIVDVQAALEDIYDRAVFIVNGGGAPGPGPGGSWPTGPLVTSNGTDLGSLGIGAGLSLSGTFPSQTLALVGGASVTLTVGSLAAESITLDGTPMVPLAGGNTNDVVTRLADGSIAWAKIGEPDGLVIGTPTGGAKGVGTLNIQGDIYQDGELFEPGGVSAQIVWGMINGSMSNQADLQAALNAAGVSFAQSFAWTNDIRPDNVCLYVNNSGQELSIRAVTGAIEADNGAAADVRVVRAAPGNPLTTGPGQDVSDPFDLEQPAGTVDALNVIEPVLLPDWRLGLRTSGNWQNSIATITVHLGPPAPTSAPVITSPLAHQSEINLPFSYQIIAPGATNFGASVPPPVGLTVNPATGLISGVPTVAGNTNVTISASNSAGTNTRTLVIRVLDEPTAWSPARASTTGRVEFSNQDRTMLANGASPYVSCLSNSNRPPGKYYVEVTVSNDYGWFGLANTNADLETFVSFTADSAGMWYEGVVQSRIRLSLGTSGSWNNFGIGAGVIGMAFDVSGSGTNKMWARNVTTDGPWTGLSSMDGDPAGPENILNGISIAWIGGGPYYLMASSGFGTNVTMNPGPTGLGTPPTGFQWWDS